MYQNVECPDASLWAWGEDDQGDYFLGAEHDGPCKELLVKESILEYFFCGGGVETGFLHVGIFNYPDLAQTLCR